MSHALACKNRLFGRRSPLLLRRVKPNPVGGFEGKLFPKKAQDILTVSTARNGGVTMQSFIPRFFEVCQLVTGGVTILTLYSTIRVAGWHRFDAEH
jgi:hypothetical protein